jgi:hypothetical protein
MLEFVRGTGKASDRKLRLFAVACCRRIWPLLPSEGSCQAVNAAERYADGELSEQRFRKLGGAAELAYEEANSNVLDPECPDPYGAGIAEAAAIAAFWLSHVVDHSDLAAEAAVEAIRQATGTPEGERRHQAGLLHEIFGPLPFRPVTLDSTWLTYRGGSVPRLAQATYDDRQLPSGHLDRNRLAVLADALEEAGCHDQDMLGHCRGPGPHTRGCWVVDLLLRKG